jgi:arylsulfatase A-like enzyme
MSSAFLIAWLQLAVAASPAGGSKAPRRPNIVLVFADDLSDVAVSAYGGRGWEGAAPLRTPHIDRLAASGARFSRAYSTPLCATSRAQVLTGRYPFRTGYTDNRLHLRGIKGLDPDKENTFANHLRDAGYRTLISGKWHNGLVSKYPTLLRDLGFDEHCVFESELHANGWGEAYLIDGKAVKTSATTYSGEVFFRCVADFIERNRREPFLVYYPITHVHRPLTATPDHPEASKTEQSNANASAHVRYLDALVGRLVAHLEALSLRQNTLVIFTTDNGTSSTMPRTLWRGRAVKGERGSSTIAGRACRSS